MISRICILVPLAAVAASAQQAIPLANDKIAAEILSTGASIISLIRKDDPAKLNPLWSPGPQPGRGHFLCLDGFGAPSKEEQAAGLRFHGEAVAQPFQTVSHSGGTLTLRATLPLLQETVTRTYRMFDGEPVLWVETEVESHVAFDRPMVWGEHATIGWPFLEPALTAVDMSAIRAQARPYIQRPGALPRRLARGQDFIWPNAPGADGKTIDLRFMPVNPNSVDHTTQLMDASKQLGWATAVHTAKRVLIGWVFRREDFPWMQNWENYPPDLKKAARGLEFSTQPYDIPRREAVDMGRLFGTPTFRWLPAKSKVNATFLVFLATAPENFTRVDDVRFEGKRLIIEDRAARLTIALPVSRGL